MKGEGSQKKRGWGVWCVCVCVCVCVSRKKHLHLTFPTFCVSGTVDGSEIPKQPSGMVLKPVVYHGISTTNLNWWVYRMSEPSTVRIKDPHITVIFHPQHIPNKTTGDPSSPGHCKVAWPQSLAQRGGWMTCHMSSFFVASQNFEEVDFFVNYSYICWNL